MAFADDLLEQAYHLANMDMRQPKQANLRRAVSTAYYALFHLLIDEAVENWGIVRQRSILARIFDHAKMRKIYEDHVRNYFSSGQPAQGLRLKNVAYTFVQLQEKRLTADYDNAFNWERTNTISQIDLVADAFKDWRAIRETEEAQDYLLTMFLPKPQRQ
jgi:hypothetical protein